MPLRGELAMAGGASHIVTSNFRDVAPAAQWGFKVVTPAEFLKAFRQP